jgi:dTDP-4-dehydrorhamnose reductase
MRVAITGAGGRLGKALQAVDWPAHVQLLPWTRSDADLADEGAALALLHRAMPDVVVHAASATDVSRCEREKQWAWENVALPALHVARGCIAAKARMVHLSTDYVFSGAEEQHPIPPQARPDPLHYYAFCKAAAEMAARAVSDHLVVRGSLKERGPWKHPKAPDDMAQTITFYDEAAPQLRDLALGPARGIAHLRGRDVNVFEHAASTRPDVQRVQRKDIGALRLPGDVRLGPWP